MLINQRVLIFISTSSPRILPYGVRNVVMLMASSTTFRYHKYTQGGKVYLATFHSLLLSDGYSVLSFEFF